MVELRTTSDRQAFLALEAPAQPTTPEPASTRLRLTSGLREQLAHLAEMSYPYESCGLLLGHAVGRLVTVEQVLFARNLDLGRLQHRYLLDPDDFLAADRAARAAGLEIVGIWHSHPDAPPRPSKTDLETAWEGYSYLIVSTSAIGGCDLASWRLKSGLFQQEALIE